MIFGGRYPRIAAALARLPDETVVDGEVVALGEDGRPSFNALQNYGSSRGEFLFYVFRRAHSGGARRDDRDTVGAARTAGEACPAAPARAHPRFRGPAAAPLGPCPVNKSAEAGRAGCKRLASRYEPGLRTGNWQKMRVNQGQEFVIGGYTLSDRNFDALIIGSYENGKLMSAGRTRNGFTPTIRAGLMKRLRPLRTAQCPFANLPEKRSGRWGQGLTAAKMAECQWLMPKLVGQFEFVEWTADLHLRHTRFIALRADKPAGQVTREQG
jgi:ATP-dependent DNA ligase